MATINVSETDFQYVASAAWAARRQQNQEASEALDKLARKINAALTTANNKDIPGAQYFRGQRKPLSWKEVPSVFDSGAKQPPDSAL